MMLQPIHVWPFMFVFWETHAKLLKIPEMLQLFFSRSLNIDFMCLTMSEVNSSSPHAIAYRERPSKWKKLCCWNVKTVSPHLLGQPAATGMGRLIGDGVDWGKNGRCREKEWRGFLSMEMQRAQGPDLLSEQFERTAWSQFKWSRTRRNNAVETQGWTLVALPKIFRIISGSSLFHSQDWLVRRVFWLSVQYLSDHFISISTSWSRPWSFAWIIAIASW